MSETHTDDPEHTAETVQAAGEDEILRTGSGGESNSRRAENDYPPIQEQNVPVGTGGERSHRQELTASETADTTYKGWLPSGAFLTAGEILYAIFIAEICWGIAVVGIVLAERMAELPELVAGLEIASTFLFGLVCGLYVLVCLRSRRLAWRKHLRGEL